MPQTEIQQRIDLLPANYREFVLSGFPRLISETFSKAHDLSEERGIALENGFALYLLFFFNKVDFIRYIQEECILDEESAKLLCTALYLAVPEPLRAIHEQLNQHIPSNTTDENILSEIAETEAALKTIPPLRTMANDGKQIGYESVEENTYSSHQSAILNESKR